MIRVRVAFVGLGLVFVGILYVSILGMGYGPVAP